MVSDDVARLLERAPGAYFLVGARASRAPHHHPEFEIDERVLGLICELLVRFAPGAVISAEGSRIAAAWHDGP